MRLKISKRNLKNLEQGKPIEPSEDDIQAQLVDGLRAHGYEVQVTSRRAKKCRTCGTYNHVGDGATKGIADLQARGRTWPKGVHVALEVKRPGSVRWSSIDQKLLAEVGVVIVVQGLDEALTAVRELDLAFERI